MRDSGAHAQVNRYWSGSDSAVRVSAAEFLSLVDMMPLARLAQRAKALPTCISQTRVSAVLFSGCYNEVNGRIVMLFVLAC